MAKLLSDDELGRIWKMSYYEKPAVIVGKLLGHIDAQAAALATAQAGAAAMRRVLGVLADKDNWIGDGSQWPARYWPVSCAAPKTGDCAPWLLALTALSTDAGAAFLREHEALEDDVADLASEACELRGALTPLANVANCVDGVAHQVRENEDPLWVGMADGSLVRLTVGDAHRAHIALAIRGEG
jgi:hypothetical protein